MKYLLAFFITVAFNYAFAQNDISAQKELDYLGHDPGLINQHGWAYSDHDSYISYLTTCYFSVAGKLSDQYKDRVAYIEASSTDVKSNKVKIDTQGASDHVLNVTLHRRPAIYRKWTETSGSGQ